MVGVYHDDFVLKLRRLEVPMVLLDYYIPTEDIPAVLIDNTDGILKACRYLASLGHRKIGYLSGDSVETSAHERLFGFRRACAAFGLDPDPGLVVENCKSRIDEGFRAMEELLRKSSPPTAVVAYNDIIAAGAMDAIKQAGFSVPGDISVMGFDDIPLAAELNPPLSTIHVPKRTMGTIAARRLVDIIKKKESIPHKVLIPARLVERASTAAVKGLSRK
jgi:LacI family transcriptional regulator